jgi:hypothetical protein
MPAGDTLTRAEVDQLIAVADNVYPSELTEHETFVESYVTGLPGERQRSVSSTLTELDTYARRTRGAPLADLSPDEREGVLRELAVDRVGSDPEGFFPERVRYFVVNQLLYGLLKSPTGG